jgi:hypothetical protein
VGRRLQARIAAWTGRAARLSTDEPCRGAERARLRRGPIRSYIFTSPQRHGDIEHRRALTVLKCATEAGLPALDLFESMRDLINAHGLTAAYATNTDHHNASGNWFTAEATAAELRRRGMVSEPAPQPLANCPGSGPSAPRSSRLKISFDRSSSTVLPSLPSTTISPWTMSWL